MVNVPDPLLLERPRYHRVLVAIDGSPASTFALRHAISLALDQHARLTLLTVVPHVSGGVVAGGISTAQLEQDAEHEAVDRLTGIVDQLPQDISVTTILKHGDPATEILAQLDTASYDLCCIGTRARARLTAALLGSVSSEVLHRSAVPVVVFHPPKGA